MMSATPVDPPTGASPRRPFIDPRPAARYLGDTHDDAGVVRAVLNGDRDAFRILVDRESASVVRACYRVLGDLSEAEDIAQEAFVSAYRSLATWRADGPFGAWLARIAVRLAVRQLGRRRSVAWVRPIEGTPAEERFTSLPAHPRTEPEHVALSAERAAATRRAVAALGEPYREVVALRFFGERSLDEIAILTGRPLSTVKTHLRRGLLRLRAGIDPGGAS
jgi:RNA polymerase sigma-70 factor (ECF subfamily)